MGWLSGAFSAVKLFTATYKFWLIALAVIAVAGSITYYVWGSERAKAKVAVLEQREKGWDAAVTTLTAVLEKNQSAISECQATNKQNTAEIGRVNRDLDKAEARVTLLDERSDDRIEDFKRDADSLRGTDPTCRTLDDPLPDSFVGSVRKPAATGSH